MVLASWADNALSQVTAGIAMQRVLLTATSLGLSASFLSQLVEVPGARHSVQSVLAEPAYPQAVLRVGFGGPVPATPRRAASATMVAEAGVIALTPAGDGTLVPPERDLLPGVSQSRETDADLNH
ncbi:hypothetical protein [Nakamurella antarctica]|uniref:hypothetical protein n=1 Tax=Nakamurella antarctica TaxID=1902245 RepID=UPI001EF0D050|nr:hypothetical protein [Nakamurella antarctica]